MPFFNLDIKAEFNPFISQTEGTLWCVVIWKHVHRFICLCMTDKDDTGRNFDKLLLFEI